MTLLEVVVLALVQGLTEFLPVSSSGHLLVARLVFGIPDVDGTTFDAFLHLGTLLALLVYYWRVWAGILVSPWRRDAEGADKRELLGKLIVASIPGALAGYFFQDYVELWLRGPSVLVASFLFTAAILWWFDRYSSTGKEMIELPGEGPKRRATWFDALLIGSSQIIALVPAISRSGVTIAAGRARGLSRPQAVAFSFLMSAPIIAGASLMSLGDLVSHHSFSWQSLFVGTVVSFVSGLLSISILMRLVQRISFLPFAIYLVVLSGVIWVLT